MNSFRKVVVLVFFVAPVFQACEVVDPLAGEQYQKDIYIVGASERIATFNVPFGSQEGTFVSIAASGTKRVEQDVEITLRQTDSLIGWYNGKYMLDALVKYQALPGAIVNVSSWKATLPAGEIYTRFPFTINTSSLHCDSLYAIGMAIDAVSNYQKAGKGTDIIFVLKLVNDWSGNYQLEASKVKLRNDGGVWVEDGVPSDINVSRILTATSDSTVRFLHEATKETLAEYNTLWADQAAYYAALSSAGIQFVHTTGNNFRVEAWDSGGMPIVDGAAEYVTTGANPGFKFWYDFDDGVNRFRMEGVFRELK